MTTIRSLMVCFASILLGKVSYAAPIPSAKFAPPTFYGQTADLQQVRQVLQMLEKITKTDYSHDGIVDLNEFVTRLAEKWPIPFQEPLRFYGQFHPTELNLGLVLMLPWDAQHKSANKIRTLVQEMTEESTGFSESNFYSTITYKETNIHFATTPNYAYILLWGDKQLLHPDQLVPVRAFEQLPKKPDHLVEIILETSRVNDLWRKALEGIFENAQVDLQKRADGVDTDDSLMMKTYGLWCGDLVSRWANHWKMIFKDAREVKYTVDFDAKSADFIVETVVTPKSDTALAKEFATLPQAEGRYAALVRPEAVMGASMSIIPKGIDPAIALLTASMVELAGEQSDFFGFTPSVNIRPILREALIQLSALAAKGKVDWGFAVLPSINQNFYGAIFAAQLPKPQVIAQKVYALFDLHYYQFQKQRAYWICKDYLNSPIYTISAKSNTQDYYWVYFGAKRLFAFGSSQDSFFMAIGDNALAEIRQAIQLKPRPAPSLQIRYQPLRYYVLNNFRTGMVAQEQVDRYRDFPELGSLLQLNLRGGKDFRFTVRSHVDTTLPVISNVMTIGYFMLFGDD